MPHRAKAQPGKQDGSVSVADLLNRQALPVRILSQDEVDTEDFVQSLLVREEKRARSRFGVVFRIIGLTVCAVIFGGVLAAATVLIGSQQTAKQPDQVIATPNSITGAAALRPDTFTNQISGIDQVLTKALNQEPLAAATSNLSSTSQVTPNPASKAAPNNQLSNTASSPNPQVTSEAKSAETKVDVVREFYQRVTSDPRSALKLLDPGIAEVDQPGFIQAWSSIKAIQPVVVRMRKDNSVLGVFTIEASDGLWLRIAQVVHLSNVSPPKITDAEVLSVQRD